MIAAQYHRSLTRRLSEQYLLYGLSGLFLFTVAAIYFSIQGTLLNSLAMIAGIPLGLLLVGSFSLRRTSRWHENIERQLTGFANGTNHSVAELRPLPTTDPLAAGWNQLLTRVLEHSAWNGVDKIGRASCRERVCTLV